MKSLPSKKKPAAKKSSRANREPSSPVASRPDMPAVYGTSNSPKGMLDWTWARKRLTNSHNYVIVTVRPDGRPHAMGMHGVWFDDAYYFSTGDTTRKARNLAANPHCILINEQLDEMVIVEGTAELIAMRTLPKGLSALNDKKYGWPLDPRGVVFKLTPKTVFAIPEKQFATALTRWKFR
jgi:Pyridoxamine 5'-phosphate oxidase